MNNSAVHEQINHFNKSVLKYLEKELKNQDEIDIAFEILQRNSNQPQHHELIRQNTLKKISQCRSINVLRTLKIYFQHQIKAITSNLPRNQRYIDWINACNKQLTESAIDTNKENTTPEEIEAAAVNTQIPGIAMLTEEEKHTLAKPYHQKTKFTLNSAAAKAPMISQLGFWKQIAPNHPQAVAQKSFLDTPSKTDSKKRRHESDNDSPRKFQKYPTNLAKHG
jgi:hypothetical protein